MFNVVLNNLLRKQEKENSSTPFAIFSFSLLKYFLICSLGIKSSTGLVFLSRQVDGNSNTLLYLKVSVLGKGRGIRFILGPCQPFVHNAHPFSFLIFQVFLIIEFHIQLSLNIVVIYAAANLSGKIITGHARF